MRIVIIISLLIISFKGFTQQAPTWTQKQLMEPADLAKTLSADKNVPLIISVGPGAIIPQSIETGMTREPQNLETLRKKLEPISRKKKIVIYCGCCPFGKCPNVRPALALLHEMKFKHYYLLNLPENIKTDWIDKGYPVVSK